MLFWCWSSVYNAGPTSNQHWFNCSLVFAAIIQYITENKWDTFFLLHYVCVCYSLTMERRDLPGALPWPPLCLPGPGMTWPPHPSPHVPGTASCPPWDSPRVWGYYTGPCQRTWSTSGVTVCQPHPWAEPLLIYVSIDLYLYVFCLI